MALLGIDVGTTELKASIYEADGRCLGSASAEWRLYHQDNRAELEAEVLWSSVRDCIRSLTRQCGRGAVRAIAFSSHGESFIPLDRTGKPIGRFVLNIDGRAALEMGDFVEKFGREHIYQITGLPPHPMYTLPKVLHLRRQDPAIVESADRFLCVEDYLLYRSGAGAATSRSLASRTMGFDIQKAEWSSDLLQYAGLSASHMAPAVPGGTAVGNASSHLATELGLDQDVVWATGGHDQACCSIGAGGLTPGTIVDGTGTFECLGIALSSPLLTPTALAAGLPSERHSVPGRYLSLAYAPGGVALKWFRDEVFRDVVANASKTGQNPYDLILSTIPDGPTGIFVLPYMFGTGTPWLDSSARAAIVGLLHDTPREALVRAALEGVTFEIRWNLELLEQLGIETRRIIAVGGGAKSSAWLQMKADIFGCEVVAVPGEASCRGAAICAGVASGEYKSFDEGVRAVVPEGVMYEPRTTVQHLYDDCFERYKDLANRIYGYKLPATGVVAHA